MGIPSGDHAEKRRAVGASSANTNDDGSGGNRPNTGRKEKKAECRQYDKLIFSEHERIYTAMLFMRSVNNYFDKHPQAK